MIETLSSIDSASSFGFQLWSTILRPLLRCWTRYVALQLCWFYLRYKVLAKFKTPSTFTTSSTTAKSSFCTSNCAPKSSSYNAVGNLIHNNGLRYQEQIFYRILFHTYLYIYFFLDLTRCHERTYYPVKKNIHCVQLSCKMVVRLKVRRNFLSTKR